MKVNHYALCLQPITPYHNEMADLPQSLFGAREVRELDRVAIEELNIDAYTLMRRAGQAAFDCLKAEWPRVESVTVMCGSGNNGGDGYVLAELALRAGWRVTVIAIKPPGTDVARHACADYQAAGGACLGWPGDLPADHGVIADGLLGTGLEQAVAGVYADAIELINRDDRPVLALDVPSGLHADTGGVMGCAVKAQLTVSFIGLKIGLFTGRGREFAGRIRFNDLAVPARTYSAVEPRARRIDPRADGLLPLTRPRDAHKGIAGRALIVGGNSGTAGAARMSGEAAYRSGAGLVEVVTPPEQVAVIGGGCPELMVKGV
ncbi:MAG: NAD(P)H-hydrate epimerase, partial [Gammaproteobacteria bacterium]|nr:NAD(P)H-hydrate epimerase [Gammaproteobacteria bacterium]